MSVAISHNAYVDHVDLVNNLFFFDGVVLRINKKVGDANEIIVGNPKGGSDSAAKVHKDYIERKYITLEFNRSVRRPGFFSRLFGAHEVLYNGIIKINDSPKYHFFSLFREKGSRKRIILSRLEEVRE